MKLIHTTLKKARSNLDSTPKDQLPAAMAPPSRTMLWSTLLLVLLATAVFADSPSSFVVSGVKLAVVGSDGMRKGGER